MNTVIASLFIPFTLLGGNPVGISPAQVESIETYGCPPAYPKLAGQHCTTIRMVSGEKHYVVGSFDETQAKLSGKE